MITKRDLIIVLATFCLAFALFTIVPVGSNYKTSGLGVYDPWIDSNDDGRINILDCIALSGVFGTTGTPINKTALLLELQARIDSLNATNLELQSKVDLLNASLLESQSRIDDLNASLASQINVLMTQMVTMNATISDLRADITVLNATKLGKPDYDSGWTAIAQGANVHFNHGLGTTEVLVYVIGKCPGFGIHQLYYGLDYYDVVDRGICWWNLDTNGINVIRGQTDTAYEQVRVMLWKIPQP
jgi:hypothetical protein